MKWFANLKIAYKLAAGFLTCLLFGLLISVLSVKRMEMMNNITKDIAENTVHGMDALGQIDASFAEFRSKEFRHVLSQAKADMQTTENGLADEQGKVETAMAQYDKLADEGEDKQNIAKLKETWAQYLQMHAQLLTLSRKNDDKSALAMLTGPMNKAFEDDLNGLLDKMKEYNHKDADRQQQEASAAFTSSRSAIIGTECAAFLMGGLLCLYITRLITRPLAQVSRAARGLAAGDTAQEITLIQKDEAGEVAEVLRSVIVYQQEMAGIANAVATGDLTRTLQPKSAEDTLGNAFVQMLANLSELVSKVQGAASSIATASAEVSAGNEDLSQRTEEQAASLEETAASMEEMAATVKNNADSSRQANQLATQARTVAEKGGAVVGQAVSSMEEINVVSKRIADIITVIDEIAFQTNLLALNAAVEAARVGEQGKGFAVVAAEVRSLASRSATAAKEIKALVQDSVGKVAEGSMLVNQSGEQLDEIVNAVKKVADVIAEISAAGQEQAEGIEQVNKAIMQMDQITQQNAALVEEASAASLSMSQQASGMLETVSQFKIDAHYQQGQAASAMRTPVVMQATGTHGGGSHMQGGRKSFHKTSAPKLTLTPKATPNKAMPTDDSDFEEF